MQKMQNAKILHFAFCILHLNYVRMHASLGIARKRAFGYAEYLRLAQTFQSMLE